MFFYLLNLSLLIRYTLTSQAFSGKALRRSTTLLVFIVIQANRESGKTYSAIKFCIRQKLENNYIIITNVKSFNYFDDTIYKENLEAIIDYVIKNQSETVRFLIFFDEIFTVLEKRTAMNKKILSFLSQLRKRKILLITTAQEWSEINITFRRYVRYQISCNMFSFPISHLAFLFNVINDGDLIKWDNDLQDFVAPRVSANFSKANKYVVDAYDTFETIKTS